MHSKLELAHAREASAQRLEAQPAQGPRLPRTPEETGLPFVFLVELTLKTFFHGGQLRLWDLTQRIKLPMAVMEPLLEFMRAERLSEVARRGPAETDISYQLTDAGRARAEAALRKSQYVGPAPVSLDSYVAQVERQSVAQSRISRDAVQRAFDGIVIRGDLLDQLGAAVNSGRAIFVYGPSGSGKTFVAEHLVNALSGSVQVPHAFTVDGEVIQVFDPLVHRPVHETVPGGTLDRQRATDERWIPCQRPVAMTGGELTLAMLDLEFDRNARFYTAPPQVKANNGIFIIDDLGRQLVDARDLMNRWIVPLDRRVDYLALHTGKKFKLPFDLTVIFSSNLNPTQLADEAFLRRLGYKIQVGAVSEKEYHDIFRQACGRAVVPYSEPGFEYLVREHHAKDGRALLACIPYDIVSKVRDRADYLGIAPELTEEALDWAWSNYFAAD